MPPPSPAVFRLLPLRPTRLPLWERRGPFPGPFHLPGSLMPGPRKAQASASSGDLAGPPGPRGRPPPWDHRPQTTDHGPQTADYRPQTTDSRPRTAVGGSPSAVVGPPHGRPIPDAGHGSDPARGSRRLRFRLQRPPAHTDGPHALPVRPKTPGPTGHRPGRPAVPHVFACSHTGQRLDVPRGSAHTTGILASATL